EGRLALSSPLRILANNDNIFNNVCLSSTQIFGNLFACHHDETVYPDPWEFKPDRFLEEGKLVGADHPAVRNFIGFGVGRRRCVGQQMARIRMFLYTTCLLQKFKIEIPKDTSLPSHDPRALLSESPVILPPPMQYCFVEC
uniref:Cytochrome P450 n=1 Tax=Magallana gigas TaxID=29159 RepID=A0A8W8KP31_MAGGI